MTYRTKRRARPTTISLELFISIPHAIEAMARLAFSAAVDTFFRNFQRNPLAILRGIYTIEAMARKTFPTAVDAFFLLLQLLSAVRIPLI